MLSSIFALLTMLTVPIFSHAGSMNSPAYRIDSGSVSSGGGNSVSAGYGTAGASVGPSAVIGPPLISAGYVSKSLSLPMLSDQALIVSTLSNGAVSASPTVNVSGKVPSSPTTTGLTINGIPVPFNPDNTFSASVPLALGNNIIIISATNQYGGVTTLTRNITYDPAAVPITITNPSNNSSVPLSQAALSLSGVAGAGGASITVSVNGASPQAMALNNGAFSGTVNILPGINTIEVICSTLTGSKSSSSITITRGGGSIAIVRNGDISGNGEVDIMDALLALRAGVGLVQLSSSDIARGDVGPLVNGVPVGDGRIDIEDAILILRKAVGLGW